MPPGRPPNHTARIAALVSQLKAALVAREQAQIEARVQAQIDGVMGGTALRSDGAPRRGPGRPRGTKNRKPRSEASRAAQAAKMKAYWAAKRRKSSR
jgi:hypothetical protein